MKNLRSGGSGKRRYEFIEHTADIAIRAYGDDIEQAFACAAGAMFDIMTDNSPVKPEQEIEFEIDSLDLEGLLVGFLSHLIVLHEVNGLVLTDFSIRFDGPGKLRVKTKGEKFDAARHRHGHHVKGVSYHMMEIDEGSKKRPASVQVLFDV
ncbi:MAG: archease [Candidatus Zixiibacteriota bacterium]|nr:MAG: archease [candidate division Zixibacteria bacterium]